MTPKIDISTLESHLDIEGFAKVASLDEIRSNDGNLSIPLYVRGRAVSEEHGEYAANGLRGAIRAREGSSIQLQSALDNLLKTLENSKP